MKTPQRYFMAALVAVLLCAAPAIYAQEEAPTDRQAGAAEDCPALTIPVDSPNQSRLRELYGNQDPCVNETVEIQGVVTQYVEDPAATTDFYYLQDDFGVAVKVRTPDQDSRPELYNTKYNVRGVVGYNRVRIDRQSERELSAFPPAAREFLTSDGDYVIEPFISEVTRGPVSPVVVEEDALIDATTEKGEGVGPLMWLLIGLAVLVLLGLAVALVRTLRSKPAATTGTTTVMSSAGGTPAGAPSTPPSAPAIAPAAVRDGAYNGEPELVEGRTIKMHRPVKDQTVKVLPGRFKVVDGLDDIPELRFFMPRGRRTAEITFGRATGRPYEHIQLKPRTVSSRQAKLVFDGGQYTLVNHASKESNPTHVNGRELDEGEAITLKAGDRITMGEVEFEYSEN